MISSSPLAPALEPVFRNFQSTSAETGKFTGAKRVIRSWISVHAQSEATELAQPRAMIHNNNDDDGCGTPPVATGDPGSPDYVSVLWRNEFYEAWARELDAIEAERHYFFLAWSGEIAEQHAARMREGDAQAAEIEEDEARLVEYLEWYDDGYRVV